LASSKLGGSYDYFWNSYFPKSILNYVRPSVVISDDSSSDVISEDSKNQAAGIVSKTQTDKEIRAFKSDVRNQMSVMTQQMDEDIDVLTSYVNNLGTAVIILLSLLCCSTCRLCRQQWIIKKRVWQEVKEQAKQQATLEIKYKTPLSIEQFSVL